MKTFIAFILLSFFPLGFSVVKAESLSSFQSASQLDRSEPSVWSIGHFFTAGSGFFIGPNLFVTNFHVVSESLLNGNTVKDIMLLNKDHSSLSVKKILALSAFYDLALIETTESVTNYLSIKEKPPESEKELFLLAYPAGKFKKIKKMGHIINEDNQLYTFPANHSSLYGSSGGPVLDEKGQIAGVISSANANIVTAIKVNHLKNLIAGNIGSDCSEATRTRICIEKEIEALKEMAEKGSPAAQYKLAYMYAHGEEFEVDHEKAFHWAKQSALKGNAFAQMALGWYV